MTTIARVIDLIKATTSKYPIKNKNYS